MAAKIGAERTQSQAAAARLTSPIENAAGESLAADIIEVHGAAAAAVARDNARSAARAAQIPQAKAWINVLGIIQRLQSHQPGKPLSSLPTSKFNGRTVAMYISSSYSTTNGFNKWVNAHRPSNDDDDSPGETVPTTITEPPSDDHPAIEEPSHQPWIVPGTGSSF
jgi:hypothetical protein